MTAGPQPSGTNRLVLAPTTLPEAEPLDFLAAAEAAGYDGVGLRLARSPGLSYRPVLGNAALIREMKRRIADSGLEVVDILSFYLQPDTDVAAFAPAIELGAEFGGRYILVMGADGDWGRMVGNFARLRDLAAASGLRCMLEAAVMRPLASLAQCVRLIEESGCRDAGICIDPLNFLRAGDTPDAMRRLDPALFPYAQISDGLLGPGEPDPSLLGRMGPNQRRMMGEGVVPVAAILDALPPGLPLSVELPDPSGRALADPDWARIALRSTRDFLARYHARQGAGA